MAGSEDIQGRAIFVSYRRDDSEGEAGRLYDDLVRAYSNDNVFMDVTGIQPGLDFRKTIDANVSNCGVLLAVIGPRWATVTDASGARRLESSTDFVRLEIAAALARGIPVIPVLVHDARMPALEELPDDLKDLRYRNSVELTHARWNSDVALLVGALKSYVTVKNEQKTETVHATVPVQLPPPQTETERAAPREDDSEKHLSRGMMIGVGIAGVIVLAVVIIAVIRILPHSEARPPTESVAAVPAAADPTLFLGDWQSIEPPPVGDNLVRLQIAQETPQEGGRILVHAWGRCEPELCDWGMHQAVLKGDELITERFVLRNTNEEQLGSRSAAIAMQAMADQLQVTVRNTRSLANAPNAMNANGNPNQAGMKPTENRQEFSKGFMTIAGRAKPGKQK